MKKIIIWSVLLFCVSQIGFAKDETLVLYLPLDEGDGNVAKDLSEYGNDAELKGKPKWADGKFGKALELDGAGSYALVPDSESLRITDRITISCWVKVIGGGDPQSAVEKGGGWIAGEYNLCAVYQGGVLLQFHDLPDNCNDENIGGSVRDGEWHFIAGTWDGKSIKVYIDGELSREMKCPGELAENSDPLFIGSRGGTQRFLMGYIDEIKIYNRALEKDELLRDMNDPREVLGVSDLDLLPVFWGELKARER
jgi:hypothetical protein